MSTQISHMMKPSRARRLVLDGFLPRPRGDTVVAPPVLSWPSKDPQDVLDYEFDIAPALIGNPSDTITSINVTVSPQNPGDLALNSVAADGSNIVLWLSAGQANTTYSVTIQVGMTSGRMLQRSVLLPVLSLSNIAPPPAGIVTDTGMVLTDQNGNPVLTS